MAGQTGVDLGCSGRVSRFCFTCDSRHVQSDNNSNSVGHIGETRTRLSLRHNWHTFYNLWNGYSIKVIQIVMASTTHMKWWCQPLEISLIASLWASFPYQRNHDRKCKPGNIEATGRYSLRNAGVSGKVLQRNEKFKIR